MPTLFVCGILIQMGVLRRILKEEAEPILALFGLSLALQNLYIYLWTADARSVPSPFDLTFYIGNILLPSMKAITFIASISIILIIHIILYRTNFGRMVRATAQNKDAAELVGINTKVIEIIIFGVSVGLTGLASFFTGVLIPFEPTSGLMLFFRSLAVVMLAGMGSVSGLVVSGVMLGVVECIGGFIMGGGFKDIFTYGLLLSMLIAKPKGLFGKY